MLSQLDRQLVLSSYAGLDPSSAQQIAQSMANANAGVSSMDSNGAGGMTGLGWANLDLGGDIGGGANVFGGTFNDTSTHWFMPFNLDPPEVIGDDSAIGLTYGFGSDGLSSGLDFGAVSRPGDRGGGASSG